MDQTSACVARMSSSQAAFNAMEPIFAAFTKTTFHLGAGEEGLEIRGIGDPPGDDVDVGVTHRRIGDAQPRSPNEVCNRRLHCRLARGCDSEYVAKSRSLSTRV